MDVSMDKFNVTYNKERPDEYKETNVAPRITTTEKKIDDLR